MLRISVESQRYCVNANRPAIEAELHYIIDVELALITQPRAAVRQLSKHSRKHRVNEMSSTRAILSAESSTVMFETELKSLDRKEKERLLKSAGITKGMTPEQGLALKADLGLPWNRLRMLRRWLKVAGVSLGAEKKQWVLSNHFVGDNLELELTPFSFTVSGGGEEIRELPMHSPRALLRRGYTMRPFICGDYEFLSGIYGLSGASGKYPCLWCLVTLDELISPSMKCYEIRTIIRDYQRFLQSGGNIKHAKSYNNCVREPFFNIALTEGIFQKLLSFFEDACHRLDLQLAHLQQDGLYSTAVLDMHSKTLQELVKTRDDLELAEQERDTVQQILTHSSMMYANSDEELESLKEFCHQNNESVQTLVLRLNGPMESLEKGFNDHPFVKGISTTLDAMGIHRQKYYGGICVVNHVNKILQSKDILINSMPKETSAGFCHSTSFQNGFFTCASCVKTYKGSSWLHSQFHKSNSFNRLTN
eukprot:Em0016g433a